MRPAFQAEKAKQAVVRLTSAGSFPLKLLALTHDTIRRDEREVDYIREGTELKTAGQSLLPGSCPHSFSQNGHTG